MGTLNTPHPSPLSGGQPRPARRPHLTSLAPLSVCVLPSLSSLELGILAWIVEFCTEIDWELRPNPPCALRGFEFISISYDLCFVLDEFDFPSSILEHEMIGLFLMTL